MGCDIHLKLEWRYKKPKESVIRPASYDDNGEIIYDEIVMEDGTEWRKSRITDWGKEWSSRVYGMFALLADVRNYYDSDHIPVRGFPEDACNDTKSEYAYYRVFDTQEEVDEYNKRYESVDGYFYAETKEKAERDVERGISQWVEIYGERRVSCPDWHSASWCTTKEMEDCVERCFKEKETLREKREYMEWKALLWAMKGYEEDPNIECRAVFWFDN